MIAYIEIKKKKEKKAYIEMIPRNVAFACVDCCFMVRCSCSIN